MFEEYKYNEATAAEGDAMMALLTEQGFEIETKISLRTYGGSSETIVDVFPVTKRALCFVYIQVQR